VLRQFAELAKFRRDAAFADKCRTEADRLHANIDKHGWDGHWYRRAYFDDGRPLGSSENPECKIDSIPQSWSVISQGGDPERSLAGMESAYKYLVRKREGLIQLFDPPFDKSDLNPGYIKGYVPGVRENGGQYTHAAIWMIMAFSILKNRERTWELLRMINPVVHGMDPDSIKKYKVEPYVIAADVYAVPQHMGQGGWTWYTGSAGWMYQLITDYVLGIRRKGNTLQFEPCIPAEWPTVTIRYRYEQTLYLITYLQTSSEAEDGKITINGMEQTDRQVYLVNDQETHQVQIQVFMKPTQEPVLKTPQVLQLGHWEKNK
jgi:cellobiose phosphorylase